MGERLREGETGHLAANMRAECTFHAFEQVKRQTTARPKLQAGVEPYGIAKDLLQVKDPDSAAMWLAPFSNWCAKWDGSLKEKTIVDGKSRCRHERLHRARRGLEKLARAGTLLAYSGEGLVEGGAIPATNNRIEGGVSRQPRIMLGERRGPGIDRRIKAVFWWCYLHTERPLPASDILEKTPTDETMAGLYRQASDAYGRDELIERWGTAI